MGRRWSNTSLFHKTKFYDIWVWRFYSIPLRRMYGADSMYTCPLFSSFVMMSNNFVFIWLCQQIRPSQPSTYPFNITPKCAFSCSLSLNPCCLCVTSSFRLTNGSFKTPGFLGTSLVCLAHLYFPQCGAASKCAFSTYPYYHSLCQD